ncbi:GNAT family N-acetyltransferase [Acidovorax carolinensis]|uniref:GNAT family N-acetyltransferase n=1 Tax=Acidovorax carolinensis TaxID=553814 RepID=UPI000B601187|nr:GNAT family N-acetyltransferase [Acidovorax carolinensis]ART49794.1 GNAT family N-acetyltransferase [Acidovorax carolinensis]
MTPPVSRKSPVRLRALAHHDLADLLAVQLACYGPGFVESAAVFARRLASPANCSLVLERNGKICAYLAAYRSALGKVTPLHGDFEPVPQADTLYLHDMAVLPAFAGQGMAQALLQSLWDEAAVQGLRHTALVSVQGSQTYWERHGYAPRPLGDAPQRERLASYGAGAVYMARGMAAATAWPSTR